MMEPFKGFPPLRDTNHNWGALRRDCKFTAKGNPFRVLEHKWAPLPFSLKGPQQVATILFLLCLTLDGIKVLLSGGGRSLVATEAKFLPVSYTVLTHVPPNPDLSFPSMTSLQSEIEVPRCGQFYPALTFLGAVGR